MNQFIMESMQPLKYIGVIGLCGVRLELGCAPSQQKEQILHTPSWLSREAML
jgi:hypothetical protein